MTEIKFKLSSDSIKQAINELKDYQDSLNTKCRQLCDELCKEGITVAQDYIGQSPLGSTISLRSEITEEEAGCKAILIATGTVTQTQDYHPFHTLVAVEFGAGIRYNNGNVNPHQDEFGMGVGTFPDQKFAKENVWWYKGNDGSWHPSSGVRATMPMYHAAEEMKEKISECARRVFSSK